MEFKKKEVMKTRQSGFTLLEVMVSLAIIAMGSIGVAQLTQNFSDDVDNTLASDSLRRTGSAAQQYIKDNYATITAAAGVATPYWISTSMLITGGYLPTGSLSTNGFNQSTCTLVLQPTANKLQAMVVTEGGTAIDDFRLGAIASLAGGSAGAVRAMTPTQVLGTLGGWSIPTASYHNLVNTAGKKCDGSAGNVQVTSGRPAMALWFDNGAYQSATLYRDPVPGHPELNTVNTPIILNAAQTVSAACTTSGAISNDATGALVSCNGGTWKAVGGSAYWGDPVANVASLPACAAANTGATRVVNTPTVGSGPRAYTCNGTAWNALSVDDSGNMVLPGTVTLGKINVTDVVTMGAACSPNGLVAKDSTGLLLSCQAGVWAKASGTPGGAHIPPPNTTIVGRMECYGYYFDVYAKVDADNTSKMALVTNMGWNMAWTTTKKFSYGTIYAEVTAVGISGTMRCPWSDDRMNVSTNWP